MSSLNQDVLFKAQFFLLRGSHTGKIGFRKRSRSGSSNGELHKHTPIAQRLMRACLHCSKANNGIEPTNITLLINRNLICYRALARAANVIICHSSEGSSQSSLVSAVMQYTNKCQYVFYLLSSQAGKNIIKN